MNICLKSPLGDLGFSLDSKGHRAWVGEGEWILVLDFYRFFFQTIGKTWRSFQRA